ncbi:MULTISPECIES: hypothetical protein [unclassified Rhizobium]|nr:MULTISPECIES: hypothetical protein [unclassified Rhizobium]MCV9941771.1 hypothetical protein [Rhizobium sp. BT-175]MCW0016275.1 hypothetical protein [Rhizobium sp. BT-226]
MSFVPIELTKEEVAELVAYHGVSLAEPLRFNINLGYDGSVVTKDGEIVGTWVMDENEHSSFIPDGASEPLFFDVFLGSLCRRIEDWLQNNTGSVAG